MIEEIFENCKKIDEQENLEAIEGKLRELVEKTSKHHLVWSLASNLRRAANYAYQQCAKMKEKINKEELYPLLQELRNATGSEELYDKICDEQDKKGWDEESEGLLRKMLISKITDYVESEDIQVLLRNFE